MCSKSLLFLPLILLLLFAPFLAHTGTPPPEPEQLPAEEDQEQTEEEEDEEQEESENEPHEPDLFNNNYFITDEEEEPTRANIDRQGNPIFTTDTEDAQILQYLQDVADEHGQAIANDLLTQFCIKANKALQESDKRKPILNNTDLQGYLFRLNRWQTDNDNKREEADRWQSIKVRFLGHAADQARTAKNQEERVRNLGELSTLEEIQLQTMSSRFYWDDIPSKQIKGLKSNLFCNAQDIKGNSEERRKRFPIIATREDISTGKAYTPESLAEKLKETLFCFDESLTDQDIKDIIINTLLSYNNKGELLNHLEEVRSKQQEEPEQEEQYITDEYLQDYYNSLEGDQQQEQPQEAFTPSPDDFPF